MEGQIVPLQEFPAKNLFPPKLFVTKNLSLSHVLTEEEEENKKKQKQEDSNFTPNNERLATQTEFQCQEHNIEFLSTRWLLTITVCLNFQLFFF